MNEGGGIYFSSSNATGANNIIRNNTATNYSQVRLTSGSNFNCSYSNVQGGWSGVGNISTDPLLITGPQGNYYLSQILAGQTQQSLCVNAGNPTSTMIIGTTRTDEVQDTLTIDMGFHYSLPIPSLTNIDLILPNGNEYISGNSICPITWTLFDSLNQVDHLKLNYSTNGGSSYPNLIADNISPSDTIYNWQVPVLNNNQMRVKVAACDSTGNVLAEDASDANFTIDSAPPLPFNLQSPANGVWTQATPLFEWEQAVDTLSGIWYYQLWIDNQLVIETMGDTNWTYPPSALAANWHTWKVKAFDRAGNNTSTTTWSFRVDAANPSAFNLITPANNTITSDATPTFQWSASSDNGSGLWGYEIFISDSIGENYYIPGNQTTFTPSPDSGLYQGIGSWYIRAYDNVNNSTQSNQTWSLTIDYTPPNSFNLISPTNNYTSYLSDIEFWWYNTYDWPAGVKKYQLVLNDSIWVDSIAVLPDTMHYWYYGLPNDTYTWKIKAVDYANNVRTSNQTWNLTVNAGPAPFSLVGPLDSTWTPDNTPLFSWNYPDTSQGSAAEYFELWIADTLHLSDIDTNFILLPDSLALNDGTNYWYVKAFDAMGNESRSLQTWRVIIDASGPLAFNLISPDSLERIPYPTPMFTWESTYDAGIGFSHYQLWLEDTLNVDNLTDTFSTPLFPMEEGYADWYVKVVDLFGNETHSLQTWTVIIDWNPPEAFDLAFPLDGDTAQTLMPLFGWHPSFDWGAGLSKYELWIDGTVSVDSIPANDTTAYPEEILSLGAHTWFVKAYDRVGGETPSNQIWQVTTLVYIPASPENMMIRIEETDICLSWNPVTTDTAGNPLTIDYYNIYRSENSYFVPDSMNWIASSEDTLFVDENALIIPNGALFYIVKAYFNPDTQLIMTSSNETPGIKQNSQKSLK